ncbi:TPA: hypothetical protein R2K55_004209 [Raoultella ornithinolytica]|uniref:hypothetical protein n=1 Tax=Raoultella ornithinolytica TaxID=54291 RepID=UPI00273FB454|nr:hypothetical protein [Raoultella ornithinolytica]WLP46290.1 hypothetical protein Q7A27_00300 [Raoultella ornithinolytica]HEC2552465.1 hypothetical protein [Raoultella ornithinolytica]HEC2605234.1 hypothetical protein [Raoultella ornithinolytica]HEC2611331.1 hypothetical protein [Raoultella ornithinolytica]
MTELKLTPFRERLTELLAHPECHQLILHLYNQENYPLPVPLEQFVGSLNGDVRRCADFILDNKHDPRFTDCAEALEAATLKVECENGAGGDDDESEGVIIERD